MEVHGGFMYPPKKDGKLCNAEGQEGLNPSW
jgi:hypothetical protein